MSKVTDLRSGSMDDYSITVTKAELEALRQVVREADGRRSETKLARQVLGVSR